MTMLKGLMKKLRKKDKGYTLVELIIVIAIIGVVAGMSVLSITLIHAARAKEAATTVDSEIATLITKSKNMKVSDPAHSGWDYAARIYKGENNTYYYQRGYFNPNAGSYGMYDFNNTDEENGGKGISLSRYVVVKFTGTQNKVNADFTVSNVTVDHKEAELDAMNSQGGVFIHFDRDGTCSAGVGDIVFYKRNGTEVAHQYIRTNGSHQSK